MTRTPEQELVKQRGEGTRSVPAGACLVEIDDKGERTLLASSYGAVTREVEAILGFKAAQFRQLMVLPQGEFRRFLMADSKERRIILETLFKTQAYRKLEEALDARAKALKRLRRNSRPKDSSAGTGPNRVPGRTGPGAQRK